MHTIRLLASATALVLLLVAPAAAGTEDAIRVTLPCDVAFDDDIGFGVVTDPACEITNVRTPDGRYRQVLRGQIPADWIDDFEVAGRPTSLRTNCLVNYGFLATEHAGEDWSGLLVFTPSVKRFTADGVMVEVCAPS